MNLGRALGLVITFSLIFSAKVVQVHADPGDWVGNGASFSENLILFAFENLDFYLRNCILDEACLSESNKFDLAKADTLKNIFKSLREEKALNPNMIQYAPQSDLFIIEGQMKVAITGLNKGDTILINRDMLFDLDLNNRQKPISLLQVVSILIHEMGHHQGIVDHHYLDKLGALVANQTRFESQFISFNPRISNLGAQFVTPRIASSSYSNSSKLALLDNEKYLDLTPIIYKIVQCPRMDSNFASVVNVILWNIYWENPMNMQSRLISYVAVKCVKSNGEYYDWIGDRLIINPSIEKIDQAYHFSSKNLSAHIEPCNRINGECSALILNYNKKQILSNSVTREIVKFPVIRNHSGILK